MDQLVLAAQQWVNATYGNVPGYNRIPEDGNTGWTTVYALTRALQHELGITSLSDSFGPTTMSRMTAHGNIGAGETNPNIVKIVQCGFYCKGYNPGGLDGVFGFMSQAATAQLLSDMGLTGTALAPKAVKALLTMDAYVVLAGGTAAVRACQQWLNSRYVARRDFYVIPCDGIFSRNVQFALYLAIQFELGLSDDQATGNFGPTTQAGLRGHPVQQGSTGVWVQLFTAAMVFNRITVGGALFAAFTATYDAGVAAAVRVFQSFSALPVTGAGDYGTWCQLVVSYGDATRPYSAADFITTVTDARAQSLVAAGVTAVGRYLDETAPVTLNKFIQPGELATIFRNGLRVFPLSEYAGTSLAYFTYEQGWDDARKAHDRAAVVYAFNTGTVIYFAVDYDATQADIDSNIVPYFDGIVAGLASKGKKYVHAVYGSRNVCAEITRRTNARWSFVSDMSYGFSGNMGYPLPDNWAFNQIQTTTIGSGTGAIQIDKDVARPGTDPGVGSVGDLGSPVDAFVDYIATLYDLALAYTGSSRNKSQLVLEYLRSRSYDDTMWWALIGDIDQGFVSYVAGQNIGIMPELREPFYGIDIHVEHWAASCDGALVVPPATGTGTGRADVAGWGGDWMTFYGEWRRDSASYSSGLTYCQEKLAKVDGDGTFKLRDLIEDADAWNIAQQLKAGVTLPDAVDAYYRGTGFLGRLSTYFTGRFASTTTCQAIAADMLLTVSDPVIVTGRTSLIQQTGGTATLAPALLPSAKLGEFCQGFADMMVAQTVQEAHSASRRAAAKTPLEAPRG